MRSGNRSRTVRATVGLAAVLVAANAQALSVKIEKLTAENQTATKPAASSKTAPTAPARPQWLADLDDAYAEARRQGSPILVRGGATWCGWCRKLDEEIAKPPVQKVLSKYVLMYVDIDKDPRTAAAMSIGSIPALRMLTPGGRLVASEDGYMPADELIGWLSKNHAQAAVGPSAALADDKPLDAKSVRQLIAQLSQREPFLREAAIRRLMGHPEIAAGPVAQLFAESRLSTRLAALELLAGWKAPVGDLDPWRPDTLTPERLRALQAWAGQAGKTTASAPAAIAGESLGEAGRELTRLLQADHDREVEVIRERLARLGPALLPVVYEQLKQISADRDRERLTALRYRLAAPARLALEWPGGFKRLASTDAQTRQQAAEDLAQRAQADAAPLLRELFSNPDPMVREISLRALRKVGGDGVNESLVELLNDPEPNVRAAVLKELTEQPSRRMAGKLVEYAVKETDADLLVHVVRVLRATGGKASLDGLISMIGHDAWQVRAEVAEAIAAVLSDSSDLPEESRADGFVALIRLIQDTDGFVISRALTGLGNADVKLVLDPLVKTVSEHPDLAPQLLKMLADRGAGEVDVAAHLRKFCKSGHPGIRAAAIEQLCEVSPKEVSAELPAAFADQNEDVRFAAARGFLTAVEAYRPDTESPRVSIEALPSVEILDLNSTDTGLVRRLSDRIVAVRSKARSATSRPASPSASAAASQPSGEDDWLDRFRAGEGRPRWMDRVIDPLENMLSAKQTERRLTAALGLIPLGRDDRALPLLREIARSEPVFVGRASRALGWLPLNKRLDLFHTLLPLASEPQAFAELTHSLAIISDLRAAPTAWRLLEQKDAPVAQAETILQALRHLYYGEHHYQPQLSAQQRKQIVAQLQQYVSAGPDIQRVIALVVLLPASRTDAAIQARKIYENNQESEALRIDALQVLLLGQSQSQGLRTAIAALSRPEAPLRDLALIYLARGRRQLSSLHSHSFALEWTDEERSHEDVTYSGQPIVPEPPAGLTADAVRPLLKADDPQVRAHAGYLLALLKQRQGLDLLLEYWRQSARNDPLWTRQVYRAISTLNDDKLTPLLEEIYGGLSREDWQIREFYWTIRSVEGEKVLALRKKIRTEIGMDRLK